MDHGRTPENALPGVEAAARMRLNWREGVDFLRRAPAGRALPWFISFGHDGGGRKHLFSLASLSGVSPPSRLRRPDFTWHFGRNAGWLDADIGMSPEDGERWRAFTTEFAAHRKRIRLSGALLFLDAGRLLSYRDADIRREAGTIRRRIDDLQRNAGRALPVYVLVNSLDRLYGMRSAVSRLLPESLAEPLGAFRSDRDEHPALFAERALECATRGLAVRLRDGSRPRPDQDAGLPEPGMAAALQAPVELSRLERPLAALCAEAFGDNPYLPPADLRGIFLGTSDIDGEAVPPLPLSSRHDFPIEREPEPEADMWFFSGLLQNGIQHDASHAAERSAGSFQSGVASLLVGLALLCGLLTWSFLDAKKLLGEYAGRASRPERTEDLGAYLDSTLRLAEANARVLPPRFGMRETVGLEREMRRRYCESYRELRLLPALNRLRDLSETAVASHDPQTVADALRLLAELGRGAPHSGADQAAVPEDAEQLNAYRLWSAGESAANDIDTTLADLERTVLAAAGGAARGRPEKAESRAHGPDEPGRVVGRVSGNGETQAVAWPLDGDGTAWTRSRATGGAPANPRLAAFRDEALRHWREKAASLWAGRLAAIGDEDLPALIEQAAAGEDPATVLLREISERLLPMFPDSDTTPEIVWLRTYAALLPPARKQKVSDAPSPGGPHPVAFIQAKGGSETAGISPELAADRLAKAYRDIGLLCASPAANIELVLAKYRNVPKAPGRIWSGPTAGISAGEISADPFADARAAAAELAKALRQTSGGAEWSDLSPMASYHYLRYLAIRLAAVNLEEKWRNAVYHSAPMIRVSRDSKTPSLADLMNGFLADASGLWVQDGRTIKNGVWDRIPFMFNRDFLDLCDRAVALGGSDKPKQMAIPFSVDAVLVDADARERPTKVEFLWGGARTRQKVVYRNYSLKTLLEWDMETRREAGIRIHFPSFTVDKLFSGKEGLGDFIRSFERGEYVVDARDFPERRDALAEIGVSRIAIRAQVHDYEEFLLFHDNPEFRLPSRIITEVGAGSSLGKEDSALRDQKAESDGRSTAMPFKTSYLPSTR